MCVRTHRVSYMPRCTPPTHSPQTNQHDKTNKPTNPNRSRCASWRPPAGTPAWLRSSSSRRGTSTGALGLHWFLYFVCTCVLCHLTYSIMSHAHDRQGAHVPREAQAGGGGHGGGARRGEGTYSCVWFVCLYKKCWCSLRLRLTHIYIHTNCPRTTYTDTCSREHKHLYHHNNRRSHSGSSTAWAPPPPPAASASPRRRLRPSSASFWPPTLGTYTYRFITWIIHMWGPFT